MGNAACCIPTAPGKLDEEDEAKALGVGTLGNRPEEDAEAERSLVQEKVPLVRFQDTGQNGHPKERDQARKGTAYVRPGAAPDEDEVQATADPLPVVQRGKVRKGTGYVKKDMQPPSEDEDEDEDEDSNA